jgi:diguanylate cyclase (GGDEF)-like protein
MFCERPRTAQLYVVGICGLALIQAALAATQPQPGAPLQLFALLTLAATIAHSFPVSAPGRQAYHVSLPFFIAAPIVLSPLQFVILVAVVNTVEGLRLRRSTSTQLFYAATFALTGLVAQTTYHALWPANPGMPADLSQPLCLVAGVAAATTFAVVNRVLISSAIWLGNRVPLSAQRLFDREELLTDGVLLLMGVPLAHLLWIAPWAGLVGAAPLWLIHRALDLPNLRAQSRQDGLTELFTAPYLTETCTRELNRGRRFNRPVSLLLLDVDGLGELNASFGQQTGDAVLRSTARTISGALREYDLAARLAGGLFAVLLPETDLAQAQVVAERVRRSTAEQRHEVPGSLDQVRVTLSVGAAIFTSQSATASQMFEAAQQALARAKHDGGNQIEFETVQAPTLVALPDVDASSGVQQRPAPLPSIAMRRRRGAQSALSTWLRSHAHTVAVCTLAAVGIGICLVGAIAELDWTLLAVMLSLSALAALAFYFRSLPLALALTGELNRSPMGLSLTRYWRQWPRYLAVGLAAIVATYACIHLGVPGGCGVIGFALLVRYLAGRYVDRTLESVRKLRNAKESLEHQAFHDSLTHLPNRALFAERLEHAMVRAGDGSVAVLFVDLDNFKTVNDTLGHAVGDALLVAATERMVQCVRREDTIARLGGDEFTILLEAMRDPSDAARMAERIGDALRQPFDLNGQQACVSSSIGIALDTDRSHAPDDLLREADLAMYRAKSGGKARYEIFDTHMAERAMLRLGLETDLRGALERDEVLALFEAIVDAASGEIAGFDVQPHWQHPKYGLLKPREFARIADETGSIVELGRWTLDEACKACRAWQPMHPGAFVQVALSERQVVSLEVVDQVREALDASGLSPRLLRLQAPRTSDASADAVLRALGDLDVRLSLENISDGDLSLAWLSQQPLDALELSADALYTPELVRGTVALAGALHMRVSLRGASSLDEAARARALGVHLLQGSLYGVAQPIDSLATEVPDRVALAA